MRFNRPLKGAGIPISGSYCANNPPSFSHQRIMCIMDRYDLPDNPNILIFNQRNDRRSDDGMVSSDMGIPVVGSVNASVSKIMGESESASNMMNEYVPTSICIHYIVLVSVILCLSLKLASVPSTRTNNRLVVFCIHIIG